jgi:hypothetical protein
MSAIAAVTIQGGSGDVSGTYVGTSFSFDYGECYPTRDDGPCIAQPFRVRVDQGGDQLTITVIEGYSVEGDVFLATLSGSSYSGLKFNDDCARSGPRPCSIDGSIDGTRMTGVAEWGTNCDGPCTEEFTAIKE